MNKWLLHFYNLPFWMTFFSTSSVFLLFSLTVKLVLITLLSPDFWLDFLGFDVFLSTLESTELFFLGWDFLREDSLVDFIEVDSFLAADNFLVDLKICSFDFSTSSETFPTDKQKLINVICNWIFPSKWF